MTERTIPCRNELSNELATHMDACWAAKAVNGRLYVPDIHEWLGWERHTNSWTSEAIKHLAHDLRRHGTSRSCQILFLQVDGVQRHLKSYRDTTMPRKNYWELAPPTL